MMAAISVVFMALGCYFLVTSVNNHQRDIDLGGLKACSRFMGSAFQKIIAIAGLDHLPKRMLILLPAALATVGATFGFLLFGSATAAIAFSVLITVIPLAHERQRRSDAHAKATESWPRIIEEIRVYTLSLGMSVPQALFAAGQRAPISMRTIFGEVERDWLLTHDFDRTIGTLKSRLNDATADATCETLRIAYRIGGTEIDDRLEALIQDRILDIQGRKDARAKQSGAKFARKFVLVVPIGMGLVGLSIGNGRAAYQTTTAQLLIALASFIIAGCWVWASYFMHIPAEKRVLVQ